MGNDGINNSSEREVVELAFEYLKSSTGKGESKKDLSKLSGELRDKSGSTLDNPKDIALEILRNQPYPKKYIEHWKLDDGRPVTLRPIKPEDDSLLFGLFGTFSEETWRCRFFGSLKEVTHEDMARFTHVEYRREMAIIGVLEEEGERKMIGVGRLIIDPDGKSGEFAVVVGDPWQGLGLGEKLTEALIAVADDKDLEFVWSSIKRKNIRMINLCEKLGFEIEEESGNTVKATLVL